MVHHGQPRTRRSGADLQSPQSRSPPTQPDLDAPRQGERATCHRRHSAEQTPGVTDIVVSFPLTFPCRSTTGRNMTPRGTRKSALLATWPRGCLARVASAPAGTGAGSALPPHPSLPAAVVAPPSLTSITDAISTATSSQPPARPAGGKHAARRQPGDHFADRLPRAACSPDLSAPRNLAVTGRSCRGLGMWGPEGRNGTAFRLPVPRDTERSRSLAPGGGAFRPPGPFRLDGGTPCLLAVGAHTTEERQNEPDGVQMSRRTRRHGCGRFWSAAPR